ncbi:unnamed protein product, partial [Coccothraustes coccothraustes]
MQLLFRSPHSKLKYTRLMGFFLFLHPPSPILTHLNPYALFLKISPGFFQYKVSDNPGNNFAHLYWSP